MKLLTNEQQDSYENAKSYFIYKEIFEGKNAKDKKYRKVRDHCHYTGKYRGAAQSICNLKYIVPKEIPIVFHNGSNYDYHFVVKVLAEEFEKQFICLGESTENYINLSIPTQKEVTKIDKNREGITKTISYRLEFIDSKKFMVSSLSNLANNLAEAIHKIKCKHEHDDRKYETCEIKCKN